MGSIVVIAPVFSLAPEPLGVFFSPCTGHQNVDLKQIDCQIFLQERWIYSGSAENCNLGSATMVSFRQVPAQQGEENSFIEGKGSWEGYSKQGVLWLFFGWVLARREEESFVLLLSSAIVTRCESPLSGLPTLFNLGFCLLIFYNNNYKIIVNQLLCFYQLRVNHQLYLFHIFIPSFKS